MFEEECGNITVAGADDFIRKPYRTDEIFDCLTRHFGARFVYDETMAGEVKEPVAALRPEARAVMP